MMVSVVGYLSRAALHLAGDKRGVTMLDYGLIAALIAAVCVGAVTTLGGNIQTTFTNIGTSV
jgi:pilus assembly protein Flp/PilA